MKKLGVMTMALCGALLAMNGAEANHLSALNSIPQQHHSGDGTVLSLGDYLALCPQANTGRAVADTRNVNVNGHNQQVVHLKGQNFSEAVASVNNLDTVRTFLSTSINFKLVRGSGRYLVVFVGFVPPGASEPTVNVYLTPDSKLGSDPSTLILATDGSGTYTIPVGNHGIPQGSQLVRMSFLQEGNIFDCGNHASDLSHLQINGRFVGIAADPAASCGGSCGDVIDGGPES